MSCLALSSGRKTHIVKMLREGILWTGHPIPATGVSASAKVVRAVDLLGHFDTALAAFEVSIAVGNHCPSNFGAAKYVMGIRLDIAHDLNLQPGSCVTVTGMEVRRTPDHVCLFWTGHSKAFLHTPRPFFTLMCIPQVVLLTLSLESEVGNTVSS